MKDFNLQSMRESLANEEREAQELQQEGSANEVRYLVLCLLPLKREWTLY